MMKKLLLVVCAALLLTSGASTKEQERVDVEFVYSALKVTMEATKLKFDETDGNIQKLRKVNELHRKALRLLGKQVTKLEARVLRLETAMR